MNEIFSDIYGFVGRQIQKTDTTYQTKIKEYINANYEKLWRAYLWRQAIVFDESVVATSGSEWLYLPKTVEEILILTDRANDQIIVPTNVQILMREFLDTIADSGTSKRYSPAGEFGVNVQPSVSAVIQAASSIASGADQTQVVRLWGVSGGEERTDTIALNGTTQVDSLLSFTEIHRVSKSATTTGVVTIRQKTTNVTLATMAPHEKVVRYPRIRLHDIPNSAQQLYLTYKKRFVSLVNDSDIVEIPVIPILKALTYADCLREQRQFQKAEVTEARAKQDLKEFINEQEMQADKIERSLPEVVLSDDDTYIFGS